MISCVQVQLSAPSWLLARLCQSVHLSPVQWIGDQSIAEFLEGRMLLTKLARASTHQGLAALAHYATLDGTRQTSAVVDRCHHIRLDLIRRRRRRSRPTHAGAGKASGAEAVQQLQEALREALQKVVDELGFPPLALAPNA